MRLIAAALVILLAPLPAIAQDAPWTLGSPTAGRPDSRLSGRVYVVERETDLRLDGREPPIDTDAPGVEALTPLTGIDAGRFGFDRIDAYLERLPEPEPVDSRFTPQARVRLTLVTRSVDGRARWWRLRPDELEIRGTPARQPRGASDGLANLPERIVAATPDPTLPVVDVQFSSTVVAADVETGWRTHLLLDFRTSEPSIIGTFSEGVGDCRGGHVCADIDCDYGALADTGCRWDLAKGAFVCATTIHRTDTPWGERRASREYYLSDSQHGWPPGPTSGPVIQSVGAFSVVAELTVGGRPVFLLGAPSMREVFSARFFLAATRTPSLGDLLEVKSRLDVRTVQQPQAHGVWEHIEGEGDSGEDYARYTPDGEPPRFASRVIAKDGRLTVFRVVVFEGSAKGVYLVGIEDVGTDVVADAMLVATDAQSYWGCESWLVPASAVAMTVSAARFAATLDIEPSSRSVGADDEPFEVSERTSTCTTRSVVGWATGEGFVYRDREIRCNPGHEPRQVVIDDDGTLHAAPGRPRPPV